MGKRICQASAYPLISYQQIIPTLALSKSGSWVGTVSVPSQPAAASSPFYYSVTLLIIHEKSFFAIAAMSILEPVVTVQPSGFTVTKSAHFKVCLRQRGGFPATPIHWLLTAQQVRSCRLNCYNLFLPHLYPLLCRPTITILIVIDYCRYIASVVFLVISNNYFFCDYSRISVISFTIE